eukprot:CAMPEP_0168353608 /NCGR_PEP_ID=MMETSP0213-20121227/23360_1 /TAXON_ID=151035 /ORGANISM="Euplotes harpa, Strain FSP1.4" /LENGTH=30 /DNA_ID= /DNA_START= /DNA_END= /DNA_ORIENTATION=
MTRSNSISKYSSSPSNFDDYAQSYTEDYGR